MEYYKDKYFKYKKKYLKYKKQLGGSDRQILALGTPDFEVFSNLECQDIMNLALSNKSLNDFIKFNIKKIYKLNKKINKKFFGDNIDNNYDEFVEICIQNNIYQKILDSKEKKLSYIPTINTRDDLIYFMRKWNSKNILNFFKLETNFGEDISINLLNGFLKTETIDLSIKNENGITDSIIDNIIELLKNDFKLEDAIQLSYESIPRPQNEINIFKELLKKSIRDENIFKLVGLIKSDEDLEKLDILEKELFEDKPKSLTQKQKKYIEILESLSIKKEYIDVLVIKRNIPNLYYHYIDDMIDEKTILNLKEIDNQYHIDINQNINICLKIIARNPEKIREFIKLKKLKLNNNYFILGSKIIKKEEHIKKYSILMENNFITFFSILGCELEDEKIEIMIKLKQNKFSDSLSYYVARYKNDIIKLEDIIRIQNKCHNDELTEKIAMFYQTTDQINNLIKLRDKFINYEIAYLAAKTLNNEQINKFIFIYEIKADLDYENDVDREDIYFEDLDDFMKKPTNVLYMVAKTFDQKKIVLFIEYLNIGLSEQSAWLAIKNIKNSEQKKVLLDLKNENMPDDDSLEGALYLKTNEQINKYISIMDQYYLNSDVFPKYKEIAYRVYDYYKSKSDIFSEYFDLISSLNVNDKLKIIFRDDLIRRIINPERQENYIELIKEKKFFQEIF